MGRGSMGAFDWGNLLGSVVGNIVGQTSKPPAVTQPAVTPPAATPAVAAEAAVAKAEQSGMGKYWPLIAVGGLGVVAIGAVVILKKKSA